MEQENQAQQHKRRVRYKGKYPKKFEEKYKELQPEKYQDTVQHVIRKGNTPAGMHISIMVKEILDFLQIQPGETGFDATLGYGGHTKAMLECLRGQGHMYATDVDPIESAKTKKRLADAGFGEDILTIRLQNFCTIDEIAKEVGGFDFILADLGVSSMQIDNPKRGFSFKVDGPLDLRLNQEKGISAAERLDTISREELAGMLYENSDEPYCEELAKAITEEIRRGNRIDTTTKLRGVIEKALELGIELPQDVVDYIAENITNNVRQIEGTVKKIKAYHDLTGMPLDITNVSRAIKDMYKGKTQAIPTPDLIISEVCRFYSIDESTLRSTLKNKGTAEARQVAMYLIRKLTNLSLPDIAKEFGKNHTTVLYALKKVEQELPNSSNGLQDNIRDITSNINSRL